MRRLEFAMPRPRAIELLREAEALHLAFTRPDGAPVLRTLNAAVTDDWVFFHGAPAGEKAQCVGRPVVLQAEQTVATVPSYFSDPEKACPATTFFVSVQAHGTLEKIIDPHLKAEALQRIMERYQPEGGHVPIRFENPMYQNAVRGVLVLGVRLGDVTGKAKLGQNRQPHEARELMERLWQRGANGDARAIALMFQYHVEEARPERFRGPGGSWLWPCLDATDAAAAARLLEGQYWTKGVARDELCRAQLGASAWVGARDEGGQLIATARANSDGARHAYIADVAVAPAHRGKGLGDALMRLLLDHPAVRNAAFVRLATRDAPCYERYGFVRETDLALDFPRSQLVLRRERGQGAPQPELGGT